MFWMLDRLDKTAVTRYGSGLETSHNRVGLVVVGEDVAVSPDGDVIGTEVVLVVVVSGLVVLVVDARVVEVVVSCSV